MYVGNDIVSLNFNIEDKYFLEQRYLDKLFTVAEQHYIWSTDRPAYSVWLLWAAKESAYKIYNKWSGKRMYQPKKFEVKLQERLLLPYIQAAERLQANSAEEIQLSPSLVLSGVVSTPVSDTFISFFPTHQFIHSLCVENRSHFNKVSWGIRAINSTLKADQSFQVRQFVLNRLAKDMQVAPTALSIIRPAEKGKMGPPELYFKGDKLKTDVSLTHDENMVGYAFL
jgi:phosphopantetheinyl transferase (holo-ACP synthase)